jgi:ankyrin repeat protein
MAWQETAGLRGAKELRKLVKLKTMDEQDVKAEVRTLLKTVDVDARDDRGRTALMLGARKDRDQRIQTLLDLGADVDATDHGGNTALMIAARGGNVKAVEVLVSHGAFVLARNADGRTAEELSKAAKHHRHDGGATCRSLLKVSSI